MRIGFEAFQRIDPHAFLAAAVKLVEQRPEVVEGVENIEIEGAVGGDVAGHPSLAACNRRR